MIHIFDASALIALLKSEPVADLTRALLSDKTAARFAHAVNLCEVYYYFARRGDESTVAATLDAFEQGGLTTRDDMDRSFWRTVARRKTEFQHASLADCFVVALAQRLDGTIVTADRPAFVPVAACTICPVLFIR